MDDEVKIATKLQVHENAKVLQILNNYGITQ